MSEAFQAGLEHHRVGEVAEAERLYRAVLADHPDHPDALFFLGLLAMNSGRLDLAVELFGRGSTVAPKHAPMFANLGEAHRRRRDLAAAMPAFLKAMTLKPDLVEPPYNLGLLLQDCGEPEGAIACFERAGELQPDLPGLPARIAALRRDASKKKSSLSAEGLVSLGKTLALHGRRDTAVALFRRALKLQPASSATHGVLGRVLTDLWQIDEAIVSLRRAVALDPENAPLHARLGDALVLSGLLDDAIASYRRAAALRPAATDIASTILFCLHYHPGYTPSAILEQAREWDRIHARPLACLRAPHENDRTRDRRLRIGYVSNDFRQHASALFLDPLFRHHDHERFEIFCYSNVLVPDAWTGNLLRHADAPRLIADRSDIEVASCVRDDRIDILVDLQMHTTRNRLGTFAQKPAPIQVCWLAYPGTTGLSTMDYRITDPFLDPPGIDTTVYSERSIRLPDTFWCYDPLVPDDAVSPLPARTAGHIRFGCLNNFTKVNDAVLELWARILREVEGATLVLLAPAGQKRTLEVFKRLGVGRKRIEFVGRLARAAYFATYRTLDICLDTFPYNGHTTSLDAFWMGVPVVTLVGSTVVGRAGLGQAKNLGMPELVAETPDQYVRIAVDLAKDMDRLANVRAGLRARMEKSPLMDGARFARNLEAAYREMWEAWCDAAAPLPPRSGPPSAE